jgi:hypothetical protein
MNEAPTTATFSAVYSHFRNIPQSWHVTITVDSLAEAQALVAALPKALRLRATTLIGCTCGGRESHAHGLVTGRAALLPDEHKGEVNEAGLARYRRTLKVLTAEGFAIDWRGDEFLNAYRTQADFEADIAR